MNSVNQEIKVKIKWGKQLYEDVPVDLAQDVAAFKGVVYAMTRVPVEKQKIMVKGKVIKDGSEWGAYAGVKEGATLMLMGTAEGGELKAPEQPVWFQEDEQERIRKEKLTSGLDLKRQISQISFTQEESPTSFADPQFWEDVEMFDEEALEATLLARQPSDLSLN